MTKRMSDEELRSAYAEGRPPRTGRRGPDCPAPDALLAALRGQGPEGERLGVLDHALKCPECRPELALLHGVSGAGKASPSGLSRISAWRRFVPLAAAASVVLSIGLFGVERWQRRESGLYRAAPEANVALVSPAGGAEVPRGAVELTWRSVPGALRYSVEVNAAGGEVLFGGETRDTLLIAQLAGAPAGRHSWWVRAHMDDGTERRSAASALELR